MQQIQARRSEPSCRGRQSFIDAEVHKRVLIKTWLAAINIALIGSSRPITFSGLYVKLPVANLPVFSLLQG